MLAVCERAEGRVRVTAFSHAARALRDQANNEAAASPDLTCAAARRSADRDKFLPARLLQVMN